MSLGYFFYRWLLPGGNWGDFCGPLPSGSEAGMGPFLHGVALLGHDVSPVCLLLVYSDWVTLEGLINNSFNCMMQEEVFCGSEGGEERSDVHRDGVG